MGWVGLGWVGLGWVGLGWVGWVGWVVVGSGRAGGRTDGGVSLGLQRAAAAAAGCALPQQHRCKSV